MPRRARDLEPIEPLLDIPIIDPEGDGRSLRGSKLNVKEAIQKEIESQQRIAASKKKADINSKTKPSGRYSGGNATKQAEGDKAVELLEAGKLDELNPKTPKPIEEDPELLELFQALQPDDYDLGISAQRIQRARLVCKSIQQYNREEKQLLVYPIIYQLHLYGYHRAEIAAILGLKPYTVQLYIRECRGIYKDELIKEYTSEDRVAESLFLYDFIKKEALRKASTASEDRAAAYLRLAAQVESERNKLLEATGYYEKIKRANMLEALEDNDINTTNRNSIVADIRDVFLSEVIDSED